jgi:hypothetical protein
MQTKNRTKREKEKKNASIFHSFQITDRKENNNGHD